MYKATFMIVISSFEWTLHWTHLHVFIIPIITATVWGEYFSLIYYTLYLTSSLEGTVFFLNTVKIYYNSGCAIIYYDKYLQT